LWLKRATTTPPTAQPCEGEVEVGCYLYSPEDLLYKNVSFTSIIIKSILKMTLLMKTFETKKFVQIFCEAFWIFFNICFNHPRLIFIFIKKKGFLNSQAVRIRFKTRVYSVLANPVLAL
jgi:hypothetical protein